MTREEAKNAQLIIQAYEESKNPRRYRIKPEPKYRPFNNAKECWQEMQKHQPFGWVKYRSGGLLMNIISIGAGITVHNNTSNCRYSFKSAFSLLTFADDAPFGIEELAK